MGKGIKLISIISLAFLLTLSGIPARNFASAQACPASNTLKMTMVIPPSSINPNTLLTGSGTSTPALLAFMEYYGVQGAPTPNGTIDTATSATDWITHDSNYTHWTFHVKPGLTWSNGQNVTASDLLASYGPKFYFNSSYDILGMGPEVKSESALNSTTALFVLNQSDAQWSNKMSIPTVGDVIFPASIVNRYGAAYPNLGTDEVMGPFYVSGYSAGQFQMTLLRNPYYKPQPAACQINVNYVESLTQTATNLLSYSSDVAQVEYSNAPSVARAPNLHLLDEKGLFITSLEYNITVYPFNMTNFRQALAYGINQTSIVHNAFDGYAATAYDSMGTVPSVVNTSWYNPNIKKYNFSQSELLQLLSSIGINKGSDGLLHYPNGTAITLTLWAGTDSTVDVIGASSIKSDLQKLGFSVNVQTTTSSNIIGDYASNIDNIATTGMILATTTAPNYGFILTDTLPGWDIYFTPTVANTYWEYPPNIDAQYQSNLSAVYSTDDPARLKQYAYNIQKINAENLPTIVLAYPDELWGFNTQRWTGWPTQGQYFVYGGFVWNPHTLLNLRPAGQASSSQNANSSSQLTTGIATATTTTSSGGGGGAISSTVSIAAVVVAVIVAGSVAALLFRRRSR